MRDPAANPHVAALLPALVAGTLAPTEHDAVQRHLAGCPACQAELAAWQAIGDATRAVYHDAPVRHDNALGAVWQRINAAQMGTVAADGSARLRSRTPRPTSGLPSAPPELKSRPETSWGPYIPVPSRARRRALPVATALLFLLTLVVGVLTWGPGRQDLAGLVVLPAVTIPPGTPAPAGIGDARVVEVTLPETLLVRGDGLGFGLSHDVIPPESETASNGGYLRIEHVLKGTVNVRSEGATQVVWATGNGAAEPVLSGAEVLLGPGDTLIAPRAASTTYRNRETAPVDLVTWGMAVNPESASNQTPPGWVSHDLDLRHGASLPPGPVRWRLQQVALEPGSELVAPTGALHQFAVSVPRAGLGASPAIAIGREGRDTFVNIGLDTANLFVVTLEPEPPSIRSVVASPAAPAAPGGG